MNILFLFLKHSKNKNDSSLTKDLSDEFYRRGHDVTVVTLLERKEHKNTTFELESNYKVLRVKTGNFFDSPGKIEKGITAVTMPFLLEKQIKKNLKHKKIDLIYTHTPYISNSKLIANLKKYFNCKSCLNLWDIFPQNAIDLNLLNNKFLKYMFEKEEQNMYKTFDYISCMSNGNLEFIKNRDKYFNENKYFIVKNWAKIKPKLKFDKNKIRQNYGYIKTDFICVFGGNMGKPQKLENILNLAEKALENKHIKFLFIGKGTEKSKLCKIAQIKKLTNVQFCEYIPRDDYELVIASCDIGIVSLDERFTVPNFPSKTTDYLKLELPILASLDKASQIDYGYFLEQEVKGGLYAQAGNVNELYYQLNRLYEDLNLRKKLGENGRKYYETELGVDKTYLTIMKKITKQGLKLDV